MRGLERTTLKILEQSEQNIFLLSPNHFPSVHHFFFKKALAVTNLQSLNVEQSNKNILLENIFIISIYKKSCINEIIFKRLSGCQ